MYESPLEKRKGYLDLEGFTKHCFFRFVYFGPYLVPFSERFVNHVFVLGFLGKAK